MIKLTLSSSVYMHFTSSSASFSSSDGGTVLFKRGPVWECSFSVFPASVLSSRMPENSTLSSRVCERFQSQAYAVLSIFMEIEWLFAILPDQKPLGQFFCQTVEWVYDCTRTRSKRQLHNMRSLVCFHCSIVPTLKSVDSACEDQMLISFFCLSFLSFFWETF